MNQLLKIQSELKAPKNQFNSFGKYKYRSCEDILEALKPLLLKYECSLKISDEIKEVGSIIFVESTATLFLTDGSAHTKVTAQAGIDPNRKGMDIAQAFGASSSYARKYALSGMFLLDESKDADATNTHGKDLDVKKNELITTATRLQQADKERALKAINDANDMKTLSAIESRIHQLQNQ